MLIFKYIPNILKDEGRSEKHLPFVSDQTLQEYLNELEFYSSEHKVIVTGSVAKDLSVVLKDGDEIIITPHVKDPVTIIGFIIASVADVWWAYLAAQIIVSATVAFLAAYSIYSAIASFFNKPNFGSTGVGGGLDESSPTYGWDGISNTQDVGTPIGVVYGEHRVGGNIINQFIHTDGDKEYLNLLIALSEGEIESIDSIEINENPSANFDGITLTKRYGTNSQEQIANFNDSHDLKPLNANLLKNNAYIYTTVNTDITAFELKLTCVGGLFQSGSGGALESWAVTYQVEYKLHSAGNYTDLGTTTIDGKSRTDLRRVFRKAGLTAGQYDIRVTRTSDDSSLDPMKQGDLYLRGVDEISQDEPLIYPNMALLGVEALATDQLSGSTPRITSLVKGKKVSVPAVLTALGGTAVAWDDYYYDPASATFKKLSDDSALYWDGTTYTTAYSANPIWCLRDLLTNTRYGLGDYITTANMDAAQLLEMAKYCEEKVSDGLGGYEKRFRLDVVIDSATKAIDLLTQLSATFRCFTFYSNGAVKLKIDKPESPVQMFGMGNILSESFVQSWKSIKEIPNVIEVQFMNKDLNYKQDTIAVMDEVSIANGDPIRKKSLRLFCTRTSQAVREGKYALNLAKCIHRTVTLKAGIDAIACQAGDVINVAHDVPAWGIGSGRVQTGSTTTKVKLDQAVTIENGKTYKIRVRFADDTQEEKYVSDGAGTYTEVNVSSAFTQAPANYDIYSLGEENKVVAPYRIISMKRAENSEVEITALEYDADVYDTDIIVLPDNNYSALSFAFPVVENLKLTERLVQLGDGTIEDAIDVWFDKPNMTNYMVNKFVKAKIYLSDNNGLSWTPAGETTGIHFAIVGNLKDLQSYKVAVVSVGITGEKSIANSPQESITVVGKSVPPSDVASFLVNQSRDKLIFGWSEVSDLDVKTGGGYEIRYGAGWNSGTKIDQDVGIIKGNKYVSLFPKLGASQSFWIKAIDSSGNYSLNATEGIVTIDNIPFTNIIESYSEAPAWGGTFDHTKKVNNLVLIDNPTHAELAAFTHAQLAAKTHGAIGPGALSGTYTTPIRDIGYVATFKIGIESTVVDASNLDRMNDNLTERMNDNLTERMSGTEVIGATSYRIRTSEDNITWSAWRAWQEGDYKCRYFQLELTLTRSNLNKILQCTQFNYYVDLPDVDEILEGEITDAGAGAALTFAKTFHQPPAVNVDILNGDGYVKKFTTEPDTLGCAFKIYDLSGVSKTGRFRAAVHGI